MAQDLYAELGIPRGSSADDIRKAFRKLAKQLHPDKNPGDKAAEERFKKVSAAFDILGDPEKKTKYDKGEIDADGRETARAYGGGGPWGGGGGGAGPWGQSRSTSSFHNNFEEHDFEDVLGQVFGARGGFRRSSGGGFSSRGADVRATLEIDLEDTINGGVKRIAFADGRTLDVTIPKGAAEGQTLRLKGQGQPGRSGQAGDALIELVIRPHPIYRREGANLHMDLPVSVPDAVLGAKVQAPTPDGPVSLTVPKGSNSGSVMRLKGRGAVEGGKRGDLLARLVVTLPDAPDSELERFAERWREERPYTPEASRLSRLDRTLAARSGRIQSAGPREGPMKSLTLAIVCTMLAAAAPAVAQPQGDSLGAGWREQQQEARKGVQEGNLSLLQVIDKIKRMTPGRQLDAGLETGANGRPVYRVRWAAADGRRIDYIVDARTGDILSAGGG